MKSREKSMKESRLEVEEENLKGSQEKSWEKYCGDKFQEDYHGKSRDEFLQQSWEELQDETL